MGGLVPRCGEAPKAPRRRPRGRLAAVARDSDGRLAEDLHQLVARAGPASACSPRSSRCMQVPVEAGRQQPESASEGTYRRRGAAPGRRSATRSAPAACQAAADDGDVERQVEQHRTEALGLARRESRSDGARGWPPLRLNPAQRRSIQRGTSSCLRVGGSGARSVVEVLDPSGGAPAPCRRPAARRPPAGGVTGGPMKRLSRTPMTRMPRGAPAARAGSRARASAGPCGTSGRDWRRV